MAIFYANLVMSVLESGTHHMMGVYCDWSFISMDTQGKAYLHGVWILLIITPFSIMLVSSIYRPSRTTAVEVLAQ